MKNIDINFKEENSECVERNTKKQKREIRLSEKE